MIDEMVILTRNGRTDWTLAVPAGDGIVERFAAFELRKYIEQMSGASLEETPATGTMPCIVVGLRGTMDGSIPLPAPAKGFDGYSISVTSDRIAIAGDNPRGVLYGVYDLLERLGCRWWQPNLDPKDPEVVPRNPNLSLPAGQWSEASPIELRFYNGSAFFFEVVPNRVLPQIEWAARNRYNGVAWQPDHRPGRLFDELERYKACGAFDEMKKRGLMFHGPCHSFPFFLPTERYFKDHPEWFGMLKGVRQPHGGQWPAVNYCWSNAEANEEFMRNVEQFVRHWPQIKILNLEWIDGGLVCQCPECSKRGAANLIVELFNELSERLERWAPGVILEAVLGYAPMLEPPQGTQPNGKWQGVYAHWGRNNRTSYNDLDYARRPDLLVWISCFPLWQMCSYYGAGSHTPFNGPPFLHALEGDTVFLAEHRARGTYVLHYPHPYWWNYAFTLGEAGRQAYYYPNRPVRAALRDYALTYFGPKAGPLVRKYLEMLGSNENLEKSYRASVAQADPGEMKWFDDMRSVLLRAQSLVANDDVTSYRVAKLLSGLDLVMKLGPGEEKLHAAEKAVEAWRSGKASAADALTTVAAGREFVKEVRVLADRLEVDYPGTSGGEWLESWTMNRVLKNPLDKLEKELNNETAPEEPAKPDHVAGPQ
jgi:hypothetical protein